MDIDNWNYLEVKGDFYNSLPLDTQMSILKKHYPIGSTFHWIQPNSSMPPSRQDYKLHTCIIEEYIQKSNRSVNYTTAPSIEWYILRVRNETPETINIREGKIYENVHPGFFRPHISSLRNKKLEQIL